MQDISFEKTSSVPLPLLEQKFTYIGKGSQCFVFLGEDKSTILKFFRCNRYRFPAWFKEKAAFKRKKWENLLTSCHIAENKLKEESALLFLHLNHHSITPKKIIVIDKLKRQFSIDLNETYFVLQKRADLLHTFLLDCKKNNNHELAKRAISDLHALIQNRQQKGIGDRDCVLAKNIGFLEGKPIFVDIGEFYWDTKSEDQKKSEMQNMACKVTPWIAQNYPEFLPFFQKEMGL